MVSPAQRLPWPGAQAGVRGPDAAAGPAGLDRAVDASSHPGAPARRAARPRPGRREQPCSGPLPLSISSKAQASSPFFFFFQKAEEPLKDCPWIFQFLG